ncbi:MAG: acetylglutamate kinase [Polyangiaceae bacterium]|jgi:acetylglutamate kinase
MLPSHIVVKLGGEVVASAHMRALARSIATLRSRGQGVVVVHGGGPQASDLQRKLGQTPRIVAGRRITDSETLEVMKMAVAGKVNVDACAALLEAGARPIGLHGASSLVVEASKRPPRVVSGGGPGAIDFGHVGDVTAVNRELLMLLSNAGYVPVIACLAADAQGHVFNINADAVANRLAVELNARALVIVSEVSGVLRDVSDPTTRIPRLTLAEGRKVVAEGVVTGGMIPKLEESFAALAGGVAAVHIVGSARAGDLGVEMAAPGSVGTVLVP